MCTVMNGVDVEVLVAMLRSPSKGSILYFKQTISTRTAAAFISVNHSDFTPFAMSRP